MEPATWASVDRHLEALFAAPDAALRAALDASAAAGLPAHHVSALQGQFLQLLARSCRARRILEIGTLAGYSTIWLARALPEDGRLVTLERNPVHAGLARENIARAGLSSRVDVCVGDAAALLDDLAGAERAAFDFVFIDADKESTPGYVERALQLTAPGALIVLDNVIREGTVIDADSGDARVQGIRRGLERLARDTRATTTVLQTVGEKGYDGFAVALRS